MRLLRNTFGPLHRFAFLFDKDGTLINTESISFDAYDRLLHSYGVRHDRHTHARMMGAPLTECLTILQGQHPQIHQGLLHHDQLTRVYRSHITALFGERGVTIMPGAASILQAAHDWRLPIAMATSDKRESTEHHLEVLGWRKYFKHIVAAEDVTRHKPAPDVFIEAARRLGVKPRDCIVFEDGPRGVAAARAAGMNVVFIRDPRFEVTPDPSHVDLTVTSLDDLFG